MVETSLLYATVQKKITRVTWALFFQFLEYCCSPVVSGVSLVHSEPHHYRVYTDSSRITKQNEIR